MNNLLSLFVFEIQRMKKYNILGASLLTAFIWMGVLQFSGVKDVSTIFPLLIFIDVTMMSMLLIGVTMFFEKQEGSIKTLLVSPINKAEYLLAKVLANSFTNLLTLFILYVYAILFKELDLFILPLICFVIIISIFHSLIGILITYYMKNFTDLLVAIMKYSFVLTIPVILAQVGIINNDIVDKILYLIPTQASIILLNSVTPVEVVTWEIIISLSYLVVGSVLLYLIVLKKFDDFAVRESGV